MPPSTQGEISIFQCWARPGVGSRCDLGARCWVLGLSPIRSRSSESGRVPRCDRVTGHCAIWSLIPDPLIVVRCPDRLSSGRLESPSCGLGISNRLLLCRG
ncbi:hypothetical protein U1Q18_039758 [Sarracenia purpurea var. burkii]